MPDRATSGLSSTRVDSLIRPRSRAGPYTDRGLMEEPAGRWASMA